MLQDEVLQEELLPEEVLLGKVLQEELLRFSSDGLQISFDEEILGFPSFEMTLVLFRSHSHIRIGRKMKRLFPSGIRSLGCVRKRTVIGGVGN